MASGSMTDLEEPILSDNDSWSENPETIDDLQRSDEKLMTGRSNQQTSPSRLNIFSSPARVVGLKTFNIVLSVATVITNVATNVTLPIFSQSLDNYSDPYYILFSSSLLFPFFFFFLLVISKFCNSSVSFRLKAPIKYVFVAGFMNALNGLLVVYASDPSRTPPALQAILSTSVIPYTVIARYVMIRKGVGVKRLVCTGVVLIGLFISMEPIIFNIDNEDSSSSGQHQSTASRVLWPACFLLGFLPVGVMNVLLEKVMKQEVIHKKLSHTCKLSALKL
ncbi:crt homolog 3-like [Ptychodera flava]|uniref:crt homolog 3-like n=1 Tax=Ptychodera flava TaxID=63121 RepID=UPI00396A121E